MKTPTPLHFDTYITAEHLEVLAGSLANALGDDVLEKKIDRRELTVVVKRGDIQTVLTKLRDNKHAPFAQLVDVCGVDWFKNAAHNAGHKERFEVVYHLLSFTKNARVRVKVRVPEGESVPSVVAIYPAANWYEREVFDMFGIRFEDHPDLRRILSDYDFDGHPLRKDFPLTGYVETYYDEKEQRVAYKPIDLPQDFRSFDKVSSWRGMTGNASLAEEDNRFESGEFKA